MKSVILGGASRSGKISVSKALKSHLKLNWYPIDPLVNAFEVAFPELGITHTRSSDDEISEKFRPFLWPLLGELHHSSLRKGYGVASEQSGYLVDTCYVSPIDAAAHRSDNLIVAFFGYPNSTVESKLESIRSNENADDWTRSWSDQQLRDHLARWIIDSQHYQTECARLELPFFETSHDFPEVIEGAFENIRAQLRRAE